MKMTALLENILIGVSTGLVAGLVTGLYSGLVISRFMRFNNLRSEALRALNSIEYMYEPDNRIKINQKSLSSTFYVAAEMHYFGHKKAGNGLMEQIQKVGLSIMSAENNQMPQEQLEANLAAAQKNVRSLAPSMKVFIPFGKV